jgi:hypothetical protein
MAISKRIRWVRRDEKYGQNDLSEISRKDGKGRRGEENITDRERNVRGCTEWTHIIQTGNTGDLLWIG